MIELSEEYRGRKSIYTRMIVDEDGVVVLMETVDFRAVHVQKDNKDYFVIYDQNMIPIRDVFRYLNFSMQHAASFIQFQRAGYARIEAPVLFSDTYKD